MKDFSDNKILIVIPAYNEVGQVGRVVRGLFEQWYENILVVNDASEDETANVALEAGAKVLSHKINRGQGASLETGNEYARQNRYDLVVHFDGDGQMNPVDIKLAIDKIENDGYDVVLGSRFLDDRSKIPFFKKFLILPIARIVNFVFTHVWLTDAHNGFRVFGKNALEKIKITQDGMAHNTEIIKQIKKYNLKYCEYPVEVKYYEFGQGILGGIQIVKDLLMNKII